MLRRRRRPAREHVCAAVLNAQSANADLVDRLEHVSLQRDVARAEAAELAVELESAELLIADLVAERDRLRAATRPQERKHS